MLSHRDSVTLLGAKEVKNGINEIVPLNCIVYQTTEDVNTILASTSMVIQGRLK